MVRNKYSSLQFRHEVKRYISELQKRCCYGFHSTPGVAPPNQAPSSQSRLFIVSLSEWFGLNLKRFLLLYCQWLLAVPHIGWLGAIL